MTHATETDLLPDLLGAMAARAGSAGQPVLVHLVANGVRGDSRVIKSASASAEQGFATIILGITVEDRPESLQVEGVPALLLPFDREGDPRRFVKAWQRHARHLRMMRGRRVLRQLVRGRRPGGPALPALGLTRPTLAELPAWAEPHPVYLNINVAFASALAALQPDVIHVQDTGPLPAAVAHAAEARRRGRRAAVLYDAHECVPELIKSFPEGSTFQGMAAIESEFIKDCDEVATVSPEIAALLKRTYRLRRAPVVVTNAPPAERDPTAPDLRSVLGLPPETPLAVYSGWIAPERGVGTALHALRLLPELHLAIVANSTNHATAALRRLAIVSGVEDRVHFAGYVPPHQITQYLSSATLGLIPRHAGGHLDLSLPTKYREFLHAGLPIVASSNRSMRRELQATGVGEVFKAGSVPGLAARITRVLDDPDRYRAAITPELLARHSWETQARVLCAAYARITPRTPAPETTVDFEDLLRSRLGEKHASGADAFQRMDGKHAGLILGIGRANSAGQAYHWAEAVTAAYRIPATSFGPSREIARSPHVEVPRPRRNSLRPVAELRRILQTYTHVVIDGFEPLFGGMLGPDVALEIEVLQYNGLRVALAAHGSDVRDPASHLARVPESYFAHASPEWVEMVANIAARNREIAAGFAANGGRVFVSTPDLLHDLPGASWLPAVIDVDQWSQLPPASGRTRPRVVHRPSRSDPPLKGSDAIVPVLEELDRAGVIDHVPDPGQIPAAAMPGLIAEADIVIDQIRTGSYGVAAVEAMAAGRVVVGSLGQDVRDAAGWSVPIVDATPETLAAVLTDLANDPARRESLAAAGRDYVTTWHSGTASAEALLPFLES